MFDLKYQISIGLGFMQLQRMDLYWFDYAGTCIE